MFQSSTESSSGIKEKKERNFFSLFKKSFNNGFVKNINAIKPIF